MVCGGLHITPDSSLEDSCLQGCSFDWAASFMNGNEVFFQQKNFHSAGHSLCERV